MFTWNIKDLPGGTIPIFAELTCDSCRFSHYEEDTTGAALVTKYRHENWTVVLSSDRLSWNAYCGNCSGKYFHKS